MRKCRMLSDCKIYHTKDASFTHFKLWVLKESYMAQNSLELKLLSRSSRPFYTKFYRELSPQKKGMDIKIDYVQLSEDPSLQLVSGIPFPSCWKLTNKKLSWGKTDPLKMMYLCIYMFSIYTYSLLDLGQQPTNLTAAPSRLTKSDLFL